MTLIQICVFNFAQDCSLRLILCLIYKNYI